MTTPLVMVVEDSPTQMTKLQIVLEAEGFQAEGAGSAEKALEMFGAMRPDLLIVDYHLPGIQGDELCRRLRMNINTQSIPILMLTMDQTMAVELHSLDSGADDYVSKSEDIDILMLRVHALLRKSRERASIVTDVPLHRRAQVLIVDDSPTYAEFLTAEMAKEGYQVVCARNGADGLAHISKSRFDCILVDLVMPTVDGVMVCKVLHEQRQPTDLPAVILMISAHETKENVTRALEAGADDFIGKSSDITVIKARVRALLRRKFILEQNRRIIEEFKNKEMEALRARTEKEAAEAKAALAEELRRANAGLEEANQKLRETQSQLVHKEKMASLGQLVAGIAHEINNPLSFVVNHVYSVRHWLSAIAADTESALSAASADRLGRAEQRLADMGQGLERVKNLVVKLRAFSRLDEDEYVTTDIPEAIDSVLLFLQHLIKDRIRVVTDYGPERNLCCRAGQINQVLMNVLANAVDAIEGEGAISVATRSDDARFIIEVADTGKGMTEEVRARIFDPFFTTKAVGEGTGLGLSISYGILKAHRGRIEFESREGQGTTATIAIPLDLCETCMAPTASGG